MTRKKEMLIVDPRGEVGELLAEQVGDPGDLLAVQDHVAFAGALHALGLAQIVGVAVDRE